VKAETEHTSDGQPDDLGARLEVAKGGAFCRRATLIARPASLNKFSSDNSPQGEGVSPPSSRFCGARSPRRAMGVVSDRRDGVPDEATPG